MAAAAGERAWAHAVAAPSLAPQQRQQQLHDAHSQAARAPHRDAEIAAALAAHDWRGVRDALAHTLPATATAAGTTGAAQCCADDVLLELQRLLFLKAVARDVGGERFASCARVDVAWRAVRAAAS
jgi:hypothetical protein